MSSQVPGASSITCAPALATAAESRSVSSTARTSVEWTGSLSALEDLSQEWKALEMSVEKRTVMSTFDYVQTWYRNYGGEYGGDPLIGLARRRGELVGAAPMVMRQGRIGKIPVTRVDFSAHDAHAGEFLVRDGQPEIVGAILESLANNVKFDVVCLNGLEKGSDQFRVLQEASRRRLNIELTDHPYAFVDLRQGYDAYCSSMSHNFRRNLKRQSQRISSAGRAVVEGIHLDSGLGEIESCIQRLFSVTEASYKLKGRPLADVHRNFLGGLVRRFAPRGMVSLSLLSIDGSDAAVVLGLVERGRYYDITLAYSEKYAHLSPGAFLMQEVLRRLAESGVHTLISRGAHDYKKRWASAFLPSTRMFLFSPSLRGRVTRLIRFSLDPLWTRLGWPIP